MSAGDDDDDDDDDEDDFLFTARPVPSLLLPMEMDLEKIDDLLLLLLLVDIIMKDKNIIICFVIEARWWWWYIYNNINKYGRAARTFLIQTQTKSNQIMKSINK